MEIVLSSIPNKIFIWLFGIVVFLPLILILLLQIKLKFNMSILLLIITIHVIIAIVLSMVINKKEVIKQEDKYKINLGGMYQIEIDEKDFKQENYEIINLNEASNYLPKLRINGIGLPGYQAGWFKLKNTEKAFVYLTQREKVLYLPSSSTRKNSILISIE